MNEFENIQRLLRLKQYETPGDEFVEDFVTQFRERQRSELLRQSARGLLWERVNTFFSDLISPKWATAAVTASVSIVAAWGTLGVIGSTSNSSHQLAIVAEPVAGAMQNQPSLAVESELIKEAELAEEREIKSILLSRHFEGDEIALSSEANFIPVSSAALPVSAEFFPVSPFGN